MDERNGPEREPAGAQPRRIVVAPPIDMDHLSRQTLGDGGIAREVLGLFLIEIGSAREIMMANIEIERREVAHRLKGAARAIGAFALAETAAHVEDAPGDGVHVAELLEQVTELERFIATFGK